MSLDAQLWEQLQAHGVYEAHLRMLLRLLEVQHNGFWAWHILNGTIMKCEVNVTFPSREYEVARVSDVLLEGNA